ncbi:sensor histidine kinase [Haloglycomyces albus]|uniref:sensor histidine kinase n=1 Tax=Haloglycomyces albus TaxID=526067 RepID=UPI00046D0649|nr:histidine kinase [Haloglycomyces albus]
MELTSRSDRRIQRFGEKLLLYGVATGAVLLAFLETSAYSQHFPFTLLLLIPAMPGAYYFARFRRSVYRRTAVVAGASITLTVVLSQVTLGSYANYIGYGELLLLGLLLIHLVRERRDTLDWTVLAALVLAIMIIPLRAHPPLLGYLVFAGLLAFPTTVSISVGMYLRGLDNARKQAVEHVRQEERTEMAREIHDFVAHHVTGMVVRAQAARFAAAHDREEAERAFGEIEEAGTEALASMRRMVAMLRRDEGIGREPLGTIGQVSALVEQWTASTVDSSVFISPQIPALPPDIEATVFRVVRESLTNIGKHAPEATGVRVTVSKADRGVEVSVRDNGTGRSSGRFAPSGVGLLGLNERVESYGGRLRWGPRSDSPGWEVSAFLPDDVNEGRSLSGEDKGTVAL